LRHIGQLVKVTAQIRQALHYFKEEWIENGELKTWPSLTMSYARSEILKLIKQ